MEEVMYTGKAFRVVSSDVNARNGKFKFEMLVNPDSAVIIPLLDKDTLIMEREYRVPVKKYLYELPAGKLDADETPIDGARRELLEETGYHAKNMKLLFKAYIAPGLQTQMLYFYVATGLSKGRRHLDEDEIIEVRRIKLEDAIKLVKRNKVEDTKTVAGLLYYNIFRYRS